MLLFRPPFILRQAFSPAYARTVRALVAAVPRTKACKTLSVDYASLRVFEALHGHLSVPTLFHFPPGTPGAGWQAFRLGRHVDNLRSIEKINPHRILPQDRALLTQMGFIWDVPKERFMLLVKGIMVYHKLYGDFVIPERFVVPDDQAWPEKLWGTNLGVSYRDIRRTPRTPCQAEVLKEQGIPLELNLDLMAERIVSALEAYKLYMNIEPGQEFTVPVKFTVPHDDVHWDSTLWGMRLGGTVDSIRNCNAYPDHHEKFRSVGLRFGKVKHVVAERILMALQAYRRNRHIQPGKNFTVPQRFTIPHDDARWDSSLWGMQLGYAVHNIRSRSDFADYHEQFRAVGLRLDKSRMGAARGRSQSSAAGAQTPEVLDEQYQAGGEGGEDSTRACAREDDSGARSEGQVVAREAVPRKLRGAQGKERLATEPAGRVTLAVAVVEEEKPVGAEAKPRRRTARAKVVSEGLSQDSSVVKRESGAA